MSVFSHLKKYYSTFRGGPSHSACGILVPQPGIELTPPAVEAQSLASGLAGRSLQYFKMHFLSKFTWVHLFLWIRKDTTHREEKA